MVMQEKMENIYHQNGEADALERNVNVDLIMSDVEDIQVIINESLMYVTQDDLEELEKKVTTTGSNITLLATEWETTEDTEEYEYDIKDSGVTSKHKVDITMDNINQQKFTGYVYTKSYDGGFKVITTEQPEENIELEATKVLIATGGDA